MSATDIAAWWGAGIATLVLIFEVVKWWLARATQMRITVSPNMQTVIPGVGVQDDKGVFVEVVNVGDRTTTLTNLCGFIYESWWSKLRKKNTDAFFVSNPAPGVIPQQLEPGQRWTGLIEQTEDIEKWSRDSLLFIGIYHSLSKKAELARLIIPETEQD